MAAEDYCGDEDNAHDNHYNAADDHDDSGIVDDASDGAVDWGGPNLGRVYAVAEEVGVVVGAAASVGPYADYARADAKGGRADENEEAGGSCHR